MASQELTAVGEETSEALQTDSMESNEAERAKDKIYEEVPLKPNGYFTRVLTLHAGDGDEDIRCDLRLVDLTDGFEEYEALSYCWGNNKQRKEILIREQPFEVTPNLYAALQSLRLPKSNRHLWVDAICINQSSIPERQAQVSIMREIYATANRTVVWLGEPTPETEVMLWLCNPFDNSNPNGEDVRVEDSLKNPPGMDTTTVIRETINRPWFRRMWVIQEVLVAKDVLLQSGSSTADFHDFLEKIAFHGFLGATTSNHKTVDMALQRRLDALVKLKVVAMTHDKPSASTRLVSLLNRFRQYESTRPVDKLFALYGLVSEEVERIGIRPKYSLSESKVFTEVAYSIMDELKDLSLLEVPRGTGVLRRNLPSWVPDWTDSTRFGDGFTPETQAERRPFTAVSTLANDHLQTLETQNALMRAELEARELPRLFELGQLSVNHLQPVQRFNGSRDSKLSGTFSRNGDNALTLEGQIIDTVTSISETMSELSGPLTFEHQKPDHWWSLSSWMQSAESSIEYWQGPYTSLNEIVTWVNRFAPDERAKYDNGESKRMAMFKTLCAGSLPDRYCPGGCTEWTDEEWLKQFNSWLSAWLKVQNLNWLNEAALFMVPKALKQANGIVCQVLLPAIWTDVNGFVGLVQAAAPTYRRRLAVTSKGYFALVPAECAVDDCVAIMQGGKVPLILRREESSYRLIGESYVHGVMFGEAWRSESCESIQLC